MLLSCILVQLQWLWWSFPSSGFTFALRTVQCRELVAFSYSRSNSSVPKEAGRQLIKSHTHTHTQICAIYFGNCFWADDFIICKTDGEWWQGETQTADEKDKLNSLRLLWKHLFFVWKEYIKYFPSCWELIEKDWNCSACTADSSWVADLSIKHGNNLKRLHCFYPKTHKNPSPSNS